MFNYGFNYRSESKSNYRSKYMSIYKSKDKSNYGEACSKSHKSIFIYVFICKNGDR